ncbi:MAG: GatB/YqeY domain-containing protein [Cyclobacteriaceae bacterium]|nr:GatB/YqeY domain-containing protein [Cyclobacteriaceae bacterium]
MSLKEQIDSAIKKAMLAKNKDELRALRAIKSLILLAESDKNATGDLDRNAEIRLLTKAVKQRKESLQIYAEQGRDDLAEKEKVELEVIGRYLPKQMSEEEVESEIRLIMLAVGAEGPSDMGKLMGAATKKLAGKADGRLIAETAKRLLNN